MSDQWSDQWSGRLSEHLDGTLPAAEARRMEEHLRECASCRETLEGLREVVARARALDDRPPARDLWPGIEAEIVGAESGARVVDLGEARRAAGRRGRRGEVRLSLPQLAAAAVVLLLMGGLGAWAAAPTLRGGSAAGGPARDAGPEVSVASTDPGVEAGPAVAREMAALEDALARSRDRLDPNTVRIVEKNLAIIDRAIRESRAALAVDPDNPFLEEHLQGALARKVDYLREATSLLQASS